MHPFLRYRLAHNLSQDEMGKRLGISGAMVSHIETGKRLVSPKRAAQFEAVLEGEVRREEMRPDVFGALAECHCPRTAA